MKIIHTSDWHIGRILHGQSLLDDQRYVLQQFIQMLQANDVDALVIAGDIYDRSVPPQEAVDVLDNTLNTIISELNIPVIMISGNHDSAQRLGFGARQMRQAQLHIMTDLQCVTDPVVLVKDGREYAFYGIPYCDPNTVNNQFDVSVKSFDEAHTYLVNAIKDTMLSKRKNILISHCFIDGATESESERPLQVGGADRVSYQPCLDFDYVALGHLHAPQHKGAEHIRYCGSLLKYSFSEEHQQKGVTLVQWDSQGARSIEHLTLTPKRDVRSVEGTLLDIISAGKTDPHTDDYILARLTDKNALLEPMNRLRAAYPNIMQLEKQFLAQSTGNVISQQQKQLTEAQIFADFYRQVADAALTDEQSKLVAEIIDECHQSQLQKDT